MKKFFVFVLLGFVSFSLANPQSAPDDELKGRDIMLMSKDREKAKTSSYKIEMTLINSRGSMRVREVSAYKKDYGDDEKSVMVFLKPADVKGVGYLSISYNKAGKNDDRWLYMPSLKKSRRITGSSSGDDFMGTDFTYDDMSGHEVEDYEHTREKDENIGGKMCWSVTSVPKVKSNYSKYISWIEKESRIPIKAEFYDKQGRLLKVMEVQSLKKIDGFWTIEKVQMENVQKKHKTVIETRKIEYNKDVKDDLFRVSTLESGTLK